MFVYQNKNHEICVSFYSKHPVESPDYVIAIDKDTKTISVNGTAIDNPNASTEEDVVEETPAVSTPSVEELDDVVENDTPVEEVVEETATEEEV